MMWISRITFFKRCLVYTKTGIHSSDGHYLDSCKSPVGILQRTDRYLLAKVTLRYSDSQITPEPSRDIIETQFRMYSDFQFYRSVVGSML
jgi:hypothetical protein